jgi:hypothetical protein
MIYLLLRIKELIMEDMWDIKRVLESRGDAHTRSNSNPIQNYRV